MLNLETIYKDGRQDRGVQEEKEEYSAHSLLRTKTFLTYKKHDYEPNLRT